MGASDSSIPTINILVCTYCCLRGGESTHQYMYCQHMYSFHIDTYIIYQHLHNTIAGTVGWVTERTHALGDERRINAVSISYSLVLIVWVHKKMESSPSLSLSSCLILGWGDGLRICTSTCSRCVRTAVAFKVADLGDYRLTDIRVCTSMPSNRSTRPDLQL